MRRSAKEEKGSFTTKERRERIDQYFFAFFALFRGKFRATRMGGGPQQEIRGGLSVLVSAPIYKPQAWCRRTSNYFAQLTATQTHANCRNPRLVYAGEGRHKYAVGSIIGGSRPSRQGHFNLPEFWRITFRAELVERAGNGAASAVQDVRPGEE